MSRLPSSARSGSPVKPSPSTPTRTAPSRLGATTPVRTRTKSAIARPSPQKTTSKATEDATPAAPTLSIREQIALRRAEAKKAQERPSGSSLNDFSTLEDALPNAPKNTEVEDDAFGRWSVRETIERGRSSGTVNLSARSLQCLPSGLFEIHLNITPDPLSSVPNEPPLPPAEPSSQKTGRGGNPAWFEAQDLQTLKAFQNDIVEIQHEISLFGSLKAIDLHKNKLASLPNSFGDLTALTTLDLSHNQLTTLPENLFSLPGLTLFNVSHNQLTSLPFNAPFASGRKPQATSGGFFTPVVVRASAPLPRLVNLDASHNRLLAKHIDLEIPSAIHKINLSFNPLGVDAAGDLVAKLGKLPNLREVRFEQADIGDDAFAQDLTPSSPFPRLELLDVGETRVTKDVVATALAGLEKQLTFDFTTEKPPQGMIQVLVGKKVVREAWELDLERKAKSRSSRTLDSGIEWGSTSESSSSRVPKVIEKEPWEIEAEQGLLTEGAKRRARAEAATAASSARAIPAPKKEVKPREVVKEAWEVEAEQGLLTEGGRRRARAQAAPASESGREKKPDSSGLGIGAAPSSSHTTSLTHPQYYAEATQTLTLPPSAPPTKAAGHARAFSAMAPSSSTLSSLSRSSSSDLAVPFASVPLAELSVQSFAQSLRVLNLTNRRMDRSFTIPFTPSKAALLPNLEELDLEGCNLGDSVPVSQLDPNADNSSLPQRISEPIIPLITTIFPRLQTLNLSYNAISSAALMSDVLTNIILEAPHHKGLRRLYLRGNKIRDLDGFQGVTDMFKGNRDVPGWKLEELDIRDNDIGKLPSEMGLLPLDVFLVDGNTFRVPPRRIWEREGTKGLLSWLRGRIE